MLRVARRFRPGKVLQITENGWAPVRCTSPQVHNAQDILFNQSLWGFHTSSCGKYALAHPPLFHPLPGLKLPPCLPDFVEPCPTNITTLPNGLKIASENILGPAACIGLFVDCGSIYESEWSHGVTHLLERMAFKSTKNRSRSRIGCEAESLGVIVAASASREQMGYTCDVLKSYLPQAIGLLIDCLRNPLFLENEVNEQLTKVKREIGEISNNPQSFLLEALHPVGYSGALANSLMASESAIDRLDGSIIRKFVDENYTAERIVLAASGVDHEELLTIAEPLLCDVRRGAPLSEPRSIYVGGDVRYPADSQKTHVALAFEVPGGWHEESDATAVVVLQTLMGGGGSFSAGGPGKGMHSRLYLRVLNRYQQIDAFSSFSSIYNQSGIFGIHITTDRSLITLDKENRFRMHDLLRNVGREIVIRRSDFPLRDKYLFPGTNYRHLVEPLAIAHFYRNGNPTSSYMTDNTRDGTSNGARDPHFVKLEEWERMDSAQRTQRTEQENRDSAASLTEDSCFWASVEEAIWSLKNLNEEDEGAKEKLQKFENYVMELIGKLALCPEVFLEKSTFMKWWEEYDQKCLTPNSPFTKFMKEWRIDHPFYSPHVVNKS